MKTGDAVTLKSGGPKMTVLQVKPSEENASYVLAWCMWFEPSQEGEPHMHKFLPEMLDVWVARLDGEDAP